MQHEAAELSPCGTGATPTGFIDVAYIAGWAKGSHMPLPVATMAVLGRLEVRPNVGDGRWQWAMCALDTMDELCIEAGELGSCHYHQRLVTNGHIKNLPSGEPTWPENSPFQSMISEGFPRKY